MSKSKKLNITLPGGTVIGKVGFATNEVRKLVSHGLSSTFELVPVFELVPTEYGRAHTTVLELKGFVFQPALIVDE